MIKSKRGWIRIVEAFVAVLLITGVVLVLMNKGYLGKKNTSEKIYEIETSILREIEQDNSLRQEILGLTLEENGIIITAQNAESTWARINNRVSEYDYLDWQAKVCKMDEICVLNNYEEGKEIYAQSVAIAATSQIYSPKQLKLFFWIK